MFKARPDGSGGAVWTVLQDAAAIVNAGGAIDAVVGGVCERLLFAVGASDVSVALGEAKDWRTRWRQTRRRFVVSDDAVTHAGILAVLAAGATLGDAGWVGSPLTDEGRTIGVLSATAHANVFNDETHALCEAVAGLLSLALQKANLRERADHLESLIVVDPLTGIPNRRAFDQALQREWMRAMRRRRSLAVALLDVDHFKHYNDTYGHPQGDECLKRLARACHATVLRSADCVARYGGEEFAVVITEGDRPAGSYMAERLRAAVESLAIPHAGSTNGIVTISVGVASATPNAQNSPHELVECADRALYRAKGTGRNQVVVYEPGTPPQHVLEVEPLRIPNNLPSMLGTLIGRDDDVRRIDDLLTQHRIVTLLGAGGVGKTRLALDVARGQLARFADGVWLVELAALTEDHHVVSGLCAPFGIEERAQGSSAALLAEALRDRRVLLVVDNCEHLVESAARALAELIRGTQSVRVLTTSREPLGIAGEATYRVPPHAIPPAVGLLNAADALGYSAVRLFVERASAATDAFGLTDANAPTVAEICRRLDGIALAIELAAARARVLDVEQIADLLDSRFRLLGGGDRSALPHQQTLRATIDWSYELLGPVERTLFERLATFAGGFTMEAITAVCVDTELEADAVFGALSALVDKSLVVFEPPRYRLLESMREYATERLAGSGHAAALAARHARYFCSVMEHASLDEGHGSYRRWVAPLVAELDNVRAALEWAFGEGRDVLTGAAICAALVETSSFGRWSEWADWNTRALAALPRDAVQLRGRLLTRRAELADRYGAFDGPTALEAAHDASRLLRDAAESKWRLEALNAYAHELLKAGDFAAAESVAREGLELARDAHDFVYQASFLRRLGALLTAGDPAEAALMFEESVALCRVLGNDFGLALCYHGMSHLHAAAGRPGDALAAARMACDVRREMGDARGLVAALADVAQFALAAGQRDGVAASLREGLELVRHTDHTLGLVLVAEAAAALAGDRGANASAARLLGYADAALESLGTRREPIGEARRATLLQHLAAGLGDDALAAAQASGRRCEPGDVHTEIAQLLA